MIRTMIRILMMMIMTTIITMPTMTMMWITVMMMMTMITMSGVMIYELSSVRKSTQQEKVLLKRIFPSNNTLSSFTGYFISSIISAVSFG